MRDQRFDEMTRDFGRGRSRRAVLAGLLGLGAVVAGSMAVTPVEAARRGYAGPFHRGGLLSSAHCPSGTECQSGICCAPDGSFCAGSGVDCSPSGSCPIADETCFRGVECFLACTSPE